MSKVEVIYANHFFGGYEHCEGVFDVEPAAEAFIAKELDGKTVVRRSDYSIWKHPSPFYDDYARRRGLSDEAQP